MRLTDFLRDLGQPVAYFAPLCDITGSVTATLLLCQLVYWTGRQADPDGWIYKTAQDWHDELRLSRHELDGARAKLRERGLVDETRRGIPAKLYYRVNLDAINAAWEGRQTRLPDSGNLERGEAADQNGAFRHSITETTSETPREEPVTLEERMRAAVDPRAVRPRPPAR